MFAMAFCSDVPRTINIVSTLAILVAFCATHNFGVGALKCNQCGWDSCGTNEELVECTLERVNQVHGHLRRLTNLSQYQEIPSPGEFVCFELQLTNTFGNRSGTVKSCSFQAAKMCDLNEWRTVKVLDCKTCSDRDYCNGFELPPTPTKVDTGAGFSFGSRKRSSSAFSSASSSAFTINVNKTTTSFMSLSLTVTTVAFIHYFFVKRI